MRRADGPNVLPRARIAAGIPFTGSQMLCGWTLYHR